jgi:hypothetical protein
MCSLNRNIPSRLADSGSRIVNPGQGFSAIANSWLATFLARQEAFSAITTHGAAGRLLNSSNRLGEGRIANCGGATAAAPHSQIASGGGAAALEPFSDPELDDGLAGHP